MATAIVTCILLGILDAIVWSIVDLPINTKSNQLTVSEIEDTETVEIGPFSVSYIQKMLEGDKVKGPTYINGRYVWTFNSKETDTKKCMIVAGDGSFCYIACQYDKPFPQIRRKYPTQKLEELYYTFSIDEKGKIVPYELFAVADKTWFFGKYEVTEYLLFNLLTGETETYTYEELPDFAVIR